MVRFGLIFWYTFKAPIIIFDGCTLKSPNFVTTHPVLPYSSHDRPLPTIFGFAHSINYCGRNLFHFEFIGVFIWLDHLRKYTYMSKYIFKDLRCVSAGFLFNVPIMIMTILLLVYSNHNNKHCRINGLQYIK